MHHIPVVVNDEVTYQKDGTKHEEKPPLAEAVARRGTSFAYGSLGDQGPFVTEHLDIHRGQNNDLVRDEQ